MELAATENSYAFHAPGLPESSTNGIQLYKKNKYYQGTGECRWWF
jgi:hypothetical protein